MALERIAKSLHVNLICIPLEIGASKKEWKSPISGKFVSVEKAILDFYKKDGWRGYAGEGGLILNLIKAMSFPQVSVRNRATYIEALYAQNVAFELDRFDVNFLLNNLKSASRDQIIQNFEIMASNAPHTEYYEGLTSIFNTSMLDFFPDLQKDMFIELFEKLGSEKIYEIAKIFSSNPYEYRKGWPDLTIWKNNQVKFLEVKSPGDRIHASQKIIINSILKPLNLDFTLIEVEKSQQT